MPPSMNTRGSSGQKQNVAGEVAADELCFSPPRRIERGLFNSPSMNTRSCLSVQKRKERPGSRPVGPGKEEVTNDDDDYTSDREEEATIKFQFSGSEEHEENQRQGAARDCLRGNCMSSFVWNDEL